MRDANPVPMPTATIDDFRAAVRDGVEEIGGNRLFTKLEDGRFTVADYHALLTTIFHQTYHAAATFALAGAHCDPNLPGIRDYLIEHASEERLHWQWVLQDLAATGHPGPDPRSSFPPPACQDYLAFNYYVAVRYPVAR